MTTIASHLVRAALLALLVPLPVAASALDAPASPTPAPSAPRIRVEPASFDFGTVRAGKSVDKEFVVRNFGSADLVLGSVVTSCDCTVVDDYATTIEPGGSTPLRVRLAVGRVPGKVERSVVVKSNDPARPSLEIKVAATVAPAPAAAR